MQAQAKGADVGQDEVLEGLRRRLGIRERDHALLEMQVRADSGAGAGAMAAGSRFLGKYRVEKQLGEEGFSRTFLARDEKLDRKVVLKVARWDSPKEAKRALREGRILAGLDHPRIVTIHDAEEVGGQLILVLEYLPQGSLAARLVMGDDVLAASEAAHAQGVVRRDVKPGNVLFTKDGRAKLADFGIPRGLTGTGTVSGGSLDREGAGTVLDMAPEQARGQAPDARSDLYAVGAVLWEAIAGKHCLGDLERLTGYEARRAVIEEAPALPLAGVPEEVNALLRKALAKDPGKRPQSAAETRRMLGFAARGLPA